MLLDGMSNDDGERREEERLSKQYNMMSNTNSLLVAIEITVP
jgi:hypothetical protein